MSLINRIKDLTVRAIVRAVHEDLRMRRLQVSVLGGELQDDVEHFEPYGFTGRPLLGAEALMISLGGDRSHAVAAVVTDRRYRPTGLDPGEVCIFDNRGRRVFLRSDGIVIDGASSPITVRTSSSVTIDAPTVHITGSVQVDGSITSTGDTSAAGISVSTHTHSGVDRGTGSTDGPQ